MQVATDYFFKIFEEQAEQHHLTIDAAGQIESNLVKMIISVMKSYNTFIFTEIINDFKHLDTVWLTNQNLEGVLDKMSVIYLIYICYI